MNNFLSYAFPYLLVLAAVVIVAACDPSKYTVAQDRVLCDPQTGEAYYVRSAGLRSSFVERNPTLDKLCPAPSAK